MFNISIRRATEEGYGLLSEKGKVLEFPTEEEARTFYEENVEGKMKWVVGWFVSKS